MDHQRGICYDPLWLCNDRVLTWYKEKNKEHGR